MPTSNPSSRASRRRISSAASSLTRLTSLIKLRSRLSGTKPAPMPWMRCGPGGPPDSTALAAGSTAMILTAPGCAFVSACPMPVIVPPVPTPATNASGTTPPSCSTSSTPVVAWWTAGLVGFLNCCGMNAWGSAAAIASAFSTAPRMTRSAGVRCSSAPYARNNAMRSGDMFSGMVNTSR
jgi:hypothetical protein